MATSAAVTITASSGPSTSDAAITANGSSTFCSGGSVTLSVAKSGLTYQWLKNGATILGATAQSYSATKAATYTCNASNSCGGTTSNAIIVTTVALPAATITALGNLDICTTGSVVLQANSGAGLTYQWKNGSNNIAAATNQSYTATSTGTFKVIVTNAGGCSKTSAGTKVTNSCKGIFDEGFLKTEMLVFPNPSTGKFTIDFKLNNEEQGSAFVQVISMIGQTIFSENADVVNGSLREEIFLDNSLTSGEFLVKVILNGKIYTERLIVQK